MTLTLSSDTEVALHSLAARRGQAPADVVEALVQRAAQEERELQETMSGLRQSAEEFAAGQWVAVEDLDAALQARRP